MRTKQELIELWQGSMSYHQEQSYDFEVQLDIRDQLKRIADALEFFVETWEARQ